MKIGVFVFALMAMISLMFADAGHLQEPSKKDQYCALVQKGAKEAGIEVGKPANEKRLVEAARIYSISPRIAKCLYPEMTVEKKPVGEYEWRKPTGPNLVTLTSRTVFRWGDYELQEALLLGPDNLSLEVLPNGSGGFRVIAVTKKIKADRRIGGTCKFFVRASASWQAWIIVS